MILLNNVDFDIANVLLKTEHAYEILDLIDIGVMLVDKDLKIVYYNTAMADIDDMDRYKVTDKEFSEVFPKSTYKQSTVLQALKEGKTSRNILQTYFTLHGKRITVLCSTYPIIEKGEIVGALEISNNISQVREMSEQIISLQDELIKAKGNNHIVSSKRYYTFDDIVGSSSKLRELIEKGMRASKTTSSILIQGETGTGKELFAQSIHSASERNQEPFISINCAAIPSELLEGIFFGTTKGAYTGAVDRPGLFEQASGGTFLLDEINSLDSILQAKLLRVLQEQTVRRVGDNKEIPLDVRIIATSNTDLRELVEKNRFRADLYYRLSVVNITIPPLRERRIDIEPLANHFLHKLLSNNRTLKHISSEALTILTNNSWHGNIRELEHVIESTIATMDLIKEQIDANDLPEYLLNVSNTVNVIQEDIMPPAENMSLELEMLDYEKNRIVDCIIQNNGNISKASRQLGMKRQTLQYRMKKLNIVKDDFQYSFPNR